MSDEKNASPLKWVGGLVVAVLAALGYIKLDESEPATPDASPAIHAPEASTTPTPDATVHTPAPAAETAAEPAADSASERRTAVVMGPKGRTDLAPTLERIEKGIEHPHRNDGSVFQNRERRLPRKPSGYYREYVHPTPGERGPGAQRVVIGKDDEVYYTADHYKTFRRVKWDFRWEER